MENVVDWIRKMILKFGVKRNICVLNMQFFRSFTTKPRRKSRAAQSSMQQLLQLLTTKRTVREELVEQSAVMSELRSLH